MRAEKRVDALYGPDKQNPDRVAYERKLTSEIRSRIAPDVQRAERAAAAGAGSADGRGARWRGDGRRRPAQGRRARRHAGPRNYELFPDSGELGLMRAWQQVDPGVKPALANLIEKNLRADGPGDVVLYRELFNRIHLEPGDSEEDRFLQADRRPGHRRPPDDDADPARCHELDRNERC